MAFQPIQSYRSALLSGGGQTFHPFSRLPYELRAQVWEAALPLGATIVASGFEVTCPVDHPFPTILHVNHESRTKTLQYYALLFNGIIAPSLNPSYIYFSPVHDTIHFNRLSLSAVQYTLQQNALHISAQQYDTIQTLEVSIIGNRLLRHLDFLDACTGLKKLTYMIEAPLSRLGVNGRAQGGRRFNFMKRMLQHWLRRLHAADPGRRVPEVWVELRARSSWTILERGRVEM